MTDDETAIRELVDAWMDASKSGDLATVLGLMTDDAIFMTPGREPFGKEEFKANALKTAFPYDYQGTDEYTAYMKKLDMEYRPLWDKFGKTAEAGAK